MGDNLPRQRLINLLTGWAAEVQREFDSRSSNHVAEGLLALASAVKMRARVTLTIMPTSSSGEPGATRPVEEQNGGDADATGARHATGSAASDRDEKGLTDRLEQGSTAGPVGTKSGPAVADGLVHYSDWASQPDIRIACDQSYTTPAWGKDTALTDTPKVYRAEDGRLYSFGGDHGEQDMITCLECKAILPPPPSANDIRRSMVLDAILQGQRRQGIARGRGEAADELTRLRDEVARLREHLGKLPSEDLWTQSLAELCRIRAAIAPTNANACLIADYIDPGRRDRDLGSAVIRVLAAINERAKL